MDKKTVKMEVVRAFWMDGKARAVGSVVDVDENFSRELQALGKAVPAVEKKKAEQK